MANENDAVTVDIILSSSGITRQGFGIPLILSNTGNAWASAERTRTYAPDITEIEVDFPSDTPEYGAALALISQPVKPTAIMFGKGLLLPTQIINLSISSVVSGDLYKVNVYCDGALQSVSYTAAAAAAWAASTAYTQGQLISNDTGKFYVCITAGTSAAGPATGPSGTASDITDGTVHWMYAGAGAVAAASNDAIVYNLMNAINALAAPAANHTATTSGSAGSKILVGTGDAAGNWFGWEPVASGDPIAVSDLMAIVDATADPGVSTDLAAILGASSTWYALILLFKSAAIVATPSTGAAAWCNGAGRLLLVSFADTASATVAYSGGTDALHTLTAAGYRYVANMWHPRPWEWFDAAKLGYFLPLPPGTEQWSLKGYEGVSAVNFTGTQKTNLLARRAAFYLTLGSVPTDDGLGQVCSTTYKWIDTVRNLDWYKVNLQADLIDLLRANNRVANTNAGRQLIEAVIVQRNQLAIQQGVMSPDPLDPTNAQAPIVLPYTVFVPPVSDAGSFNGTTRALSGVTSRWKLAGAIRSIAVTVNVTQ